MSVLDTVSRGQEDRSAGEDSSPVLHWPLAPETLRLKPGQAHLWAAAFHEFEEQAPNLALLLPSAEQVRARKFRFAKHRNRYLIRRGLLRLILSRYLQKLPSAIEYRHGAHGKPEVRSDGASAPLFFNTSHSDEVAICAITSACSIGVDVERMREIPKIEEIAGRFFLPRETQTWMALSPAARLEGFYSCWTRKEAVLKATGEGIAQGLAKMEVTLSPVDPPGVVSVAGDPRAHEQWQLHPFSPAPGYLGCVAYRHAALAISQWRMAKSPV